MKKVSTSPCLQAAKPALLALMNRLLKIYPYVSILAEDGLARQYSVSKSGVGIGEDSVLTTRGAVVRVYDGETACEYSFNQFDEEHLARAEAMIREKFAEKSRFLPGTVTLAPWEMPDDSPCIFHKSTSFCQHPLELGDEAILGLLSGISRQGREADKRIIDCIADFTFRQYSKLFLSPNRDMLQDIMWSNGEISAFAAKGDKVESSYRGFSGLAGAEILQEMEKGLDPVIRTTLELLESEPVPPGEYECICAPGVTGLIAHEAFGHGVEMDMFVKKRALAEQYMGKPVASELVTMHDGAMAAEESGSYFFDDEGVLAGDTVVIDKGILRRGISDSQSAARLGTRPTGNGRREAFDHKAYARMTNTFFEKGRDSVEDMIASISYGFLLEEPSSGMEDPKNWGIQCMVNIAREIRDGKLTGKIYSPIVLTGYVPDLLRSISMVSKERELEGGGFCGKGYKEWVKVSDGGPYIKARIRLG